MTKEQIEALRKRLSLTPEQLPDDADDAAIMAVLSTEPSGEGGEGDPPTPEPDPKPEGEPTVTPPNLPEGFSVIDDETLSRLREGAEAGITLAASAAVANRDTHIGAAIKAGKLPPSRKQYYEQLWEKDPKGTKEFIDSLAEGLVPVQARGTSGGESMDADDSQYDVGWLSPAEQKKIAATKSESATSSKVIQGGD